MSRNVKSVRNGICLVMFLIATACSNDANTGEHNEGIGREGQRNNIESVDNTNDSTNADMNREPHYTNEDTAQMHRKVTGDQVPGK